MVITNALNPRILQPGDIDPNWRWDKHIPSLGHMAVDFEKRVDHDRLRRYRLSRSKDALKNSAKNLQSTLKSIKGTYNHEIPKTNNKFYDEK